MTDPQAARLGFLREIAENPDDSAPRLMFADWLEEQGDRLARKLRRIKRCETVWRNLFRKQYPTAKPSWSSTPHYQSYCYWIVHPVWAGHRRNELPRQLSMVANSHYGSDTQAYSHAGIALRLAIRDGWNPYDQ